MRSPDEGSTRLSIAAASIPEWSRGLIVVELGYADRSRRGVGGCARPCCYNSPRHSHGTLM